MEMDFMIQYITVYFILVGILFKLMNSFYCLTDLGLSFIDVLFYGHEWSLLSLEILLFLLTDHVAENLAAVITYITYESCDLK